LLCLRNARAFPLLPAALASVPFGFVLVRVRVRYFCKNSELKKNGLQLYIFHIDMPYAILIIDEGFDIYNTRHTYLPREGLGFMNEKSRAPLVRSLLCAVCSHQTGVVWSSSSPLSHAASSKKAV